MEADIYFGFELLWEIGCDGGVHRSRFTEKNRQRDYRRAVETRNSIKYHASLSSVSLMAEELKCRISSSGWNAEKMTTNGTRVQFQLPQTEGMGDSLCAG